MRSKSNLKIMTIHNSTKTPNPLFSCIITLYTLIFLYFPHDLHLSLSPPLVFTFLLLLFLLRLGVIQRLNDPIPEIKEALETTECKETINVTVGADHSVFNEFETDRKPESGCSPEGSEIEEINENGETDNGLLSRVDTLVGCEMDSGQDPESVSVEFKENCNTYFQLTDKPSSLTRIDERGNYPNCENLFVEWDVGAPLEVIYEDYEGEDGEEDPNDEKSSIEQNRKPVLDRHPSLSMYYPETDSDSSSEIGFPLDGDSYSPEDDSFRWGDEEDKDEGWLIEIDIGKNKKDDSGRVFCFEEDNLIEIDLSPIKNDDVFVGQA